MSPLPCNGRPVRPATRPGNAPSAFTLVELLVVVSVIGLLVAILVPSLSVARKQARAVLCLSRCRALGVGMNMYLNEFGAFPAHQLRMRDFDPTLVEDVRFRWFDAMALELSSGTLMRPRDMANAEWEQVRRDNLFFDVQTCPSTKQWEVGRNNAYGYNYKYLGSARTSLNTANRHRPYECYPIQGVRAPADTIAFADCDGTGWTKPWAPEKPRGDHDPLRLGNHGYILDPTYIPVWSSDTLSGTEHEPYAWANWRAYLSDRHLGKSRGIFADGHGEPIDPVIAYRDNALWNGLGQDPGLRPDGTQDPRHPLYHLDPHVAERWDASSGQEWRYPQVLDP